MSKNVLDKKLMLMIKNGLNNFNAFKIEELKGWNG